MTASATRAATLLLTIAAAVSLPVVSRAADAAAPKDVTYQSGSETVHGLLYSPAAAGKHPAVIVIHEWWGLNDWVKEQASELIAEQLKRMSQGEPPLSPSIARRVISHFASQTQPQERPQNMPHVALTDRENEVLLRVAKGFTLPEIGVQLNLSRHTIADYVKQIYRKLNVSSRAEAALEAQRLGLFRR